VGQVQALLEEASEAVQPAYEEIGAALRSSVAVGVDETGWRYRERRAWLWGATTPRVSYYHPAPGRNRLALSRVLGPDYDGIVGSDRLSTYAGRDPRRRQHCWAHLLRDFRAWQSRTGVAAEIGQAAEAEGRRIFHLWHRFRRGELNRAALKRALRLPKARLTRLL
jgi:transposase